MKKCYVCKENKRDNEFNKNRSKKDGLAPECKLCRMVYRRLNRRKISEYNNRYRNNLKKESYEPKILDLTELFKLN